MLYIEGNAYAGGNITVYLDHGAVIVGASIEGYTGPWPPPPAWTEFAEESEGELESDSEQEPQDGESEDDSEKES